MINYGYIPADPSNFSKKRKHKIEYIVIHYTGHDSQGSDTAKGNALYFHNNSKRLASANAFADPNSIATSVLDTDMAWHCGKDFSNGTAKYYKKCTNLNSLGIELCCTLTGKEYTIDPKTIDNALLIVKAWMKKYKIPATKVIRHWDACGKPCPEPFVKHPEQWIKFKERLVK